MLNSTALVLDRPIPAPERSIETHFAFVRVHRVRSISYLKQQEAHAERDVPTAELFPRMASVGAIFWSAFGSANGMYVDDYRRMKSQLGARERKGAALCVHMLVGVSSGWIRGTGDLHDPHNPRVRRLFGAVREFCDRHFNGVFAMRMDLDERGGGTVDVFATHVHDRQARLRKRGGRGAPVREISVTSALDEMSRLSGADKSYTAMQTLWAEYAREKLDAGIVRGVSVEVTGHRHLSVQEYRQSRARAEELRERHIGSLRTISTTASVYLDALDNQMRREAEQDDRERSQHERDAALSARELDLELREIQAAQRAKHYSEWAAEKFNYESGISVRYSQIAMEEAAGQGRLDAQAFDIARRADELETIRLSQEGEFAERERVIELARSTVESEAARLAVIEERQASREHHQSNRESRIASAQAAAEAAALSADQLLRDAEQIRERVIRDAEQLAAETRLRADRLRLEEERVQQEAASVAAAQSRVSRETHDVVEREAAAERSETRARKLLDAITRERIESDRARQQLTALAKDLAPQIIVEHQRLKEAQATVSHAAANALERVTRAGDVERRVVELERCLVAGLTAIRALEIITADDLDRREDLHSARPLLTQVLGCVDQRTIDVRSAQQVWDKALAAREADLNLREQKVAGDANRVAGQARNLQERDGALDRQSEDLARERALQETARHELSRREQRAAEQEFALQVSIETARRDYEMAAAERASLAEGRADLDRERTKLSAFDRTLRTREAELTSLRDEVSQQAAEVGAREIAVELVRQQADAVAAEAIERAAAAREAEQRFSGIQRQLSAGLKMIADARLSGVEELDFLSSESPVRPLLTLALDAVDRRTATERSALAAGQEQLALRNHDVDQRTLAADQRDHALQRLQRELNSLRSGVDADATRLAAYERGTALVAAGSIRTTADIDADPALAPARDLVAGALSAMRHATHTERERLEDAEAAVKSDAASQVAEAAKKARVSVRAVVRSAEAVIAQVDNLEQPLPTPLASDIAGLKALSTHWRGRFRWQPSTIGGDDPRRLNTWVVLFLDTSEGSCRGILTGELQRQIYKVGDDFSPSKLNDAQPQAISAGLEKIFRPTVVDVRSQPFAPA